MLRLTRKTQNNKTQKEEWKTKVYLLEIVYWSKLKVTGRLCCSNSLVWIFPLLSQWALTTKKLKKTTSTKTKNYKIEIKCKISGGVIIQVTDKVIRIIRNVIRIIEIDKYYTDSGNTNSSHISKNDFNTCKQK